MSSRVDYIIVDPRGDRRRKAPPVTHDPQTSPYHLLIIAALSQAEHELARRRRSTSKVPGKTSGKVKEPKCRMNHLAANEAIIHTTKAGAARPLPLTSGSGR